METETSSVTYADSKESLWLSKLRLTDIIAVGWALYGPVKDGESHHATDLDEAEMKIAKKVVDLLDQLDISSPDGLYVFRLNAIATSFARGIIGARHVLTERRAQAREVKDISFDRVAVKIGWQVMARVATQLLLLGGFSFLVSYLIFGQVSVPKESLNHMALLTSLGSMLLGMAGQMAKIESKQKEVEGVYYHALDAAKEKQCDKLLASLERARESYNAAYLERYGHAADELSMNLASDIRTINLLRMLEDRVEERNILKDFYAGIRQVIKSIFLLGRTRQKTS